MIPVLTSDRLILRGWFKSDFDRYAAFWADSDRTRHFISGTQDRSSAWSLFANMMVEWCLNGFGIFALQSKDTDEVVGYAGLWYPADIDEAELAWSLYSGYEGKGFATEAARRIIRWASQGLCLPPLMSFVHPDNTPSIAVAERLGATRENETTLRGSPRFVFRHAPYTT